MSGDFYRDTDVLRGSSNSRAQNAPSIRSQQGGAPYAMSQYGGMPQLPMMPFGTGPGSAAGSEYGGMSMPVMAPMPYQHTGSIYGMDMMAGGAPRNTIMSNMNMFGSGSASQLGVGNMTSPFNMQQRPMSTFSMATTANLFQGPSMNADPTDDELFASLKSYLATQDLMSVTKKFVSLLFL
jgi:chitin synthase